MNTNVISALIVEELGRSLGAISPEDGERLVEAILKAGHIFVAGAGRSGFMVKAFAMRLMHLGFVSFVVGETVTPNLGKDDLLVIGSGSGETGSLVSIANNARMIGAAIAAVTVFPESIIGKLADIVVAIPAPTLKGRAKTECSSMQPTGSLFEQSLLLFLDSVIVRLMERQKKDSTTMFARHANLE
jgi:6-phospho-3-hexuloisomerase